MPVSKPAPPLLKTNPGTGVAARAKSKDGRSWSEEVDVVALAATTLARHEHAVERQGGWLHHAESGFAIVPRIVTFEPVPDGGVHTVTTVQVNHPALAPDGVFEYQHATGDGLGEAISSGFSQWAELDFVPLLDALQPPCAPARWRIPRGPIRRHGGRRITHASLRSRSARMDPHSNSSIPARSTTACSAQQSFTPQMRRG